MMGYISKLPYLLEYRSTYIPDQKNATYICAQPEQKYQANKVLLLHLPFFKQRQLHWYITYVYFHQSDTQKKSKEKVALRTLIRTFGDHCECCQLQFRLCYRSCTRRCTQSRYFCWRIKPWTWERSHPRSHNHCMWFSCRNSWRR